jgi:hypothetical protein
VGSAIAYHCAKKGTGEKGKGERCMVLTAHPVLLFTHKSHNRVGLSLEGTGERDRPECSICAYCLWPEIGGGRRAKFSAASTLDRRL